MRRKRKLPIRSAPLRRYQKREKRLRYLAMFGKASAQFLGDVDGHVAGPPFGGVEGHNPNRMANLAGLVCQFHGALEPALYRLDRLSVELDEASRKQPPLFPSVQVSKQPKRYRRRSLPLLSCSLADPLAIEDALSRST